MLKPNQLDKDQAYQHFLKTISNSNTNSITIFEILDLKKEGHFFTFLSDTENLNRINDFRSGGLKESPRKFFLE